MKNVYYAFGLTFMLLGAAFFSSQTAVSFASDDFVPNAIVTTPGAFKDGEAHVQGICCTEDGIYATFMNYIYKLDWSGNVVKSAPAIKHSGDPCVVGDKIYVSMSCSDGTAIHEYDLDLNLVRKITLENCPACDGIAYLDGYFYIGGPSKREPHEDNLVHVYDKDWKFVRKDYVNFGVKTDYGPQSICAWKDKIFYAFYVSDDNPKDANRSLCVDPDLKNVAAFPLDGSNGWTLAPESKQPSDPNKALFLVARTTKIDGQTCAKFRWYMFDNKELKFSDVTKE